MSLYRIYLKSQGVQEVEGKSPTDAFKKINSNVYLEHTTNVNIADVRIVLCSGKRRPANYYIIKQSQQKPKKCKVLNITETDNIKQVIAKCKLLQAWPKGTIIIHNYDEECLIELPHAYIIPTVENSYVLYIPAGITILGRRELIKFLEKKKNVNLKVIGGSDLINADGLFSFSNGERCYINNLDLTDWNTSNVTSMKSVFSKVTVQKIIGLNNLDTNKVTTMADMFGECITHELDINFNTSNVDDMKFMFSYCKVDILQLGANFRTNNVMNASLMFHHSYIKQLNAKHLCFDNILNIEGFCSRLYAETLYFEELKIQLQPNIKVKDLFECCQINELKISKFTINLESVILENNFDYAKITQLVMCKSDFEQLKKLDLSNATISNIILTNTK